MTDNIENQDEWESADMDVADLPENWEDLTHAIVVIKRDPDTDKVEAWLTLSDSAADPDEAAAICQALVEAGIRLADALGIEFE